MTTPTDPHAAHWQAIAEAAHAVCSSLNCTAEQANDFCRAIDRLSDALVGEAEDALKMLDWMQLRKAGVEWEDDLEDPVARITLPRRYGERVRLGWYTNLRSAVATAMVRDNLGS